MRIDTVRQYVYFMMKYYTLLKMHFNEIVDVVILHVILREQPFNFYGAVLVFYFDFTERKKYLEPKDGILRSDATLCN